MIKVIEKRADGNDIIEMKNDYLQVIVTNYGATIIKIIVEDKEKNPIDCVLGYDTIKDYQSHDRYLGSLVGRVANRIAKGEFELNGQKYHLPINNGPNSSHGGISGFNTKTFNYQIKDNQLILNYLSKDGEEGYPGDLNLKATYALDKNKLILNYQATSSKDTLINITNHSYFNLAGDSKVVDDHYLQIKASKYACIDHDGLVTGEIKDVNHTPFDFREMKQIKDLIYQDDEQLRLGRGYDHPFIFDETSNQVILYNQKTGIELSVSTTLPQAQIYSANYLSGKLGKGKVPYPARSAICVETQNMPDSIHLEKEPTTILKKGEQYDETTSYCFRIKK